MAASEDSTGPEKLASSGRWRALAFKQECEVRREVELGLREGRGREMACQCCTESQFCVLMRTVWGEGGADVLEEFQHRSSLPQKHSEGRRASWEYMGPNVRFGLWTWVHFLFTHNYLWNLFMGFPDSSVDKESTCNTGDPSLIRGLERSAGEGIGCPLQYS